MKQKLLFLLLAISISAKAQINNSGFEIWDTTYLTTYTNYIDTAYSVPGAIGGDINSWYSWSWFGICRTTDSHSGNYSAILHNWYNYAHQDLNYKNAINYQPQFLQGFYKYNTGGENTIGQGYVTVSLTHFNGSSNDTIGTGSFAFDSTASFTPFEVAINYTSSQMPDSIHIYFMNAILPCGFDVVCHLLYLDDLVLSDVGLTNEAPAAASNISFYPNPATDQITFVTGNNDEYTLIICDALGRLCKVTAITNNATVSLADVPGGLNLLTVLDKEKNIVMKKSLVKD